MSSVVDLATWKRRREETASPSDDPPSRESRTDGIMVPLHPAFGLPAAADEVAVDRLDEAVQRLHALVSGALDGRGSLEPRVETELLAILGELTVGLTKEAADRAERLADHLAR